MRAIPTLKISISGVRGVVGQSLTPKLLTRFAQAFGTHTGSGTIVIGLHGDVPERFAAQMFARTAPEDLARYEPREIAALAAEAWRFLKERAPGAAKVRMQSRGGP